MSDVKNALKEIAFQLKVLSVTVAALELKAREHIPLKEYTDLRSKVELEQQATVNRLDSLIAEIAD
jgi:hypothetical protein